MEGRVSSAPAYLGRFRRQAGQAGAQPARADWPGRQAASVAGGHAEAWPSRMRFAASVFRPRSVQWPRGSVALQDALRRVRPAAPWRDTFHRVRSSPRLGGTRFTASVAGGHVPARRDGPPGCALPRPAGPARLARPSRRRDPNPSCFEPGPGAYAQAVRQQLSGKYFQNP